MSLLKLKATRKKFKKKKPGKKNNQIKMNASSAEIEPVKEEKTFLKGYEELQNVLYKAVGKIGLRSTISLLMGCAEEVKQNQNEAVKRLTLPSFILSMVMEIYQMDEATIYKGTIRECADARKICYHLCGKYNGYSRSKIGLHFGGASKRKVQDSISKTEEMLAFPKFNKIFCSNYVVAEKAVIEFLARSTGGQL